MRMSMRVHFLHRNFRDTMIIMEEANIPHPQCPRYDMLVPWKVLNGRHITTAQCAKEVEQKRRRFEAENISESAARAFQDYSRPLETVTSFK